MTSFFKNANLEFQIFDLITEHYGAPIYAETWGRPHSNSTKTTFEVEEVYFTDINWENS